MNKNFLPDTLQSKLPNLFVIRPDVQAKDFKEIVAPPTSGRSWLLLHVMTITSALRSS